MDKKMTKGDIQKEIRATNALIVKSESLVTKLKTYRTYLEGCEAKME